MVSVVAVFKRRRPEFSKGSEKRGTRIDGKLTGAMLTQRLAKQKITLKG
jgi:hypothetical protein